MHYVGCSISLLTTSFFRTSCTKCQHSLLGFEANLKVANVAVPLKIIEGLFLMRAILRWLLCQEIQRKKFFPKLSVETVCDVHFSFFSIYNKCVSFYFITAKNMHSCSTSLYACFSICLEVKLRNVLCPSWEPIWNKLECFTCYTFQPNSTARFLERLPPLWVNVSGTHTDTLVFMWISLHSFNLKLNHLPQRLWIILRIFI